MWKVEYLNAMGQRIFWKETFPTRKAARHWCKRANKPGMKLHGPNGVVEDFTRG